MARTALSPINLLGTNINNAVLPTTGAVSLVGFTGFQFQNNGMMFVYLTIGAAGAGNLTLNFGRAVEGQIPAPFVLALANSTNYLLGPWSPTDFTSRDGTGNTYFDLSVVTGNAVSLYQLVPLQ